MSVLARAKARTLDGGYAGDFVELVMKPLLAEIKRQCARDFNAGGVNVRACAAAHAAVAAASDIELKIGIVEGDDVTARLDDLRRADVREMFTGAPIRRA